MVPRMKTQKTLSERWLWLGVTALALAGIFAVILVIARTPQFKELTLFQQLFSVALVVHVDLSVLMWFIAVLGIGTAQIAMRYGGNVMLFSKAGFYTIAGATALMALSPLDPEWEVIKSNYIPVLHNALFLLSLGLLAAGLAAMLAPLLWIACRATLDGVELGWMAAAVSTAIALVAFFLSGYLLPPGLPHDVLYEQLFWAGGHILQFSFTLLMMAAWLALLSGMGKALPSRTWLRITYGLALLGAFASFGGFVLHPFDTSDFSYFQTRVMIELGGIGVSLLAVMIVAKLVKGAITRTHRAYASALVMSLIVFFAGGALGLLITGQNVTIPAHYHGMIVGITLALMGYAYTILPRFGYASVAATRLAFWQPIVYGVGQLMHIGGLGYSGGYGILRKTPGAAADLPLNLKIALGVMGGGGAIAILGGLLFVVVMVRAYRKSRHS